MKFGISYHFLLAILLLGCSLQYIYGKGGRGGGGRSSSSGRGYSSSRSSSSSSRYSSSSSSRYSPSSSGGYSPASSSRYSPSSSSRYSPSSSSRYSPSSSSRYSPSSSSRYSPSSNNGYSSSSIRQSSSSSSINSPSSNNKYSFSSMNDPKWDKMIDEIRQQSRKDAEKIYARRMSKPKLTPPPYNSLGRQPAYNPNFKEISALTPPPYNSLGRQPAYNPYFEGVNVGFGFPHSGIQHSIQPAYNPNFKEPSIRPIQPGIMNPQPVNSARPRPYPVQPGAVQPYPVQLGVLNPQPPHKAPKPYPVQPGATKPYPVQPGAAKPYPVQPGAAKPYPVQPGVAKPYPVQPGMPLGANVWHAQSGIPPPAYMNYGGLPTGINMQNKPHKKKGFLGSLISAGKPSYSKPKHYNSFPNLHDVRGYGSTGYSSGLGSFIGKHGNTGTMYTILPYMANKKARKLFKPKIGYHPVFFHRHHHHHYHRGYQNSYVHEVRSENYQGIESSNYADECKRPLLPKNSVIACNSTINEINCQINCSKGYKFPDNSTDKINKCWHMTGVWRPMKNFPACEPVCNTSCLNGGKCIGPDACGCKSDYRGSRCEFHFLKCDIHQLARKSKITWVCTHSRNETSCRVKCRPPGEFADGVTTQEYHCSVDGTWMPSSEPDCVVKEVTTEVANATEIEVANATEIEAANATEIEAANATEIEAANTTEIEAENATKIKDANATEIEAANATEIEVANATEIKAANATEIKATETTKLQMEEINILKDLL